MRLGSNAQFNLALSSPICLSLRRQGGAVVCHNNLGRPAQESWYLADCVTLSKF